MCTIFELWEGSASFASLDSLSTYRTTNSSRFHELYTASKFPAFQRSPWMEAWDQLMTAVAKLPVTVNGKPRELFPSPQTKTSGSLTIAEQLFEVETGSLRGFRDFVSA